MIPQVLQDMALAITAATIPLPFGSGDARRDSSTAEQSIIAWLQNQRQWDIHSPNIDIGHNRSWYDVQIDDFYCDIKVSELQGQDNTNAKCAVYYFLTGADATNAPVRWDAFFRDMSEKESASEIRDFYFIVVTKPRAESFIVSLKGIAEVRPAHNNPPFQCNWGNCRVPTQRTWQEARKYLLGKWAEAIQRGIDTYRRGMPTYYPEFFR